MRLKHPKVSVVVSTYKRGDMLKRFLESVMEQTFTDYEVIVVDDAGGEAKGAMEDIVPRFKEKGIDCYLIVMGDNSGYQSVPKNIGIAHSRGSYIAQADDDDVWYSHHLESLVSILEDGGCDIAFGSWDFGGDRDGETWEYIPFNPITAHLIAAGPQTNFISCHTVWSKGAVLGHLGPKPWNEEVRRFGDWDLYRRCLYAGLRFKGTDVPTYKYMWHGENLQVTRPPQEVDVRAVPLS
jgi:glycosyltransferase involved in cell wall biosynthesis